MGGRIGNPIRNLSFKFRTSCNTCHLEGPSETKPSEPSQCANERHRRPERERDLFKMHSKLMTKAGTSRLVFSPSSRASYPRGKNMQIGDGQGKRHFKVPRRTSSSRAVTEHWGTINLPRTHSSFSLLPSQTQQSSLSPRRIIMKWYSYAAISQSCFPAR